MMGGHNAHVTSTVDSMTTSNDEIQKWESAEVVRSASEAKRNEATDLRLGEHIVQRYLNPPADTFYSLECSYQLLGDLRGKTVLDYGCGLGENSVILASRGAKVIGVDISPELIELAQKRLDQHGLGDRVEFRVGSAHELPMADGSIDVVFGIAILHHLDLKLSSQEVFRVLKPGGRAIFQEPVRNSKVIKFLRGMIPYRQPDVSPFERPLTDAELQEYAARFTSYRSRPFSLPFVNLLEVLRAPERIRRSATTLSGRMLQQAPVLARYSSVRVIELTK
jgi:SAM-dependent methyltransferase